LQKTESYLTPGKFSPAITKSKDAGKKMSNIKYKFRINWTTEQRPEKPNSLIVYNNGGKDSAIMTAFQKT
jgi:hypothetical protein